MTYLALTNTTTVERIFSPNKYRPPRRAKGERWKVPARQAHVTTIVGPFIIIITIISTHLPGPRSHDTCTTWGR
jgi:hypothetical protein